MRRREAVQFLGAALALPFIPRNAEKAIKLAEEIHRRLGDVPFRTLNPDQQKLVTAIAEMIIPETDTPGATSVSSSTASWSPSAATFISLVSIVWAERRTQPS